MSDQEGATATKARLAAAGVVMVASVVFSCTRAKPDLKQEASQVKAAMEQVAQSGTLRIHVTNRNSHGEENDLTIELQCPDRMRLTNNGEAQGTLEGEVLIGSTWYYKLRDRGWLRRPNYRSDIAITCKDVELKWANELIVDPYGKYNAHDVGPWAINARPCHKWTLDNPLRSYAPELMKPAEVCINAQHQLLLFDQSGYKWEFYDYGAPVEINPPDGWTEQ